MQHLSPGRTRDNPVMDIVPQANKSLSLSLSLSPRLSRRALCVLSLCASDLAVNSQYLLPHSVHLLVAEMPTPGET